MRRLHLKAFTLIELLIVVAIIAILAAIAVPNFLEAQVRSKVARAKTDMRSIATALEAYCVDTNQYPPDVTFFGWTMALPMDPVDPRVPLLQLYRLTTPTAYMTSLPKAPFTFSDKTKWENGLLPDHFMYKTVHDWKTVMLMGNRAKLEEIGADMQYSWVLNCVGPDRIWNVGEWYLFGEKFVNLAVPGGQPVFGYWGYGCLYDPTNGTLSTGDIARRG
jgi:prepilin-type N-terminal cleavage/methylation domain-containing protein